jgi:hypothetical protein
LEKLFTDKRFQPIIISANPKWSWSVDTGGPVHFLDGVVVLIEKSKKRNVYVWKTARDFPGTCLVGAKVSEPVTIRSVKEKWS